MKKEKTKGRTGEHNRGRKQVNQGEEWESRRISKIMLEGEKGREKGREGEGEGERERGGGGGGKGRGGGGGGDEDE